jgi:hypothetical protein
MMHINWGIKWVAKTQFGIGRGMLERLKLRRYRRVVLCWFRWKAHGALARHSLSTYNPTRHEVFRKGVQMFDEQYVV